MTDTFNISIEKVGESKLSQTKLTDIKFGSIFTDHMLLCDFENGEWANPKIMPYQDIPMNPATVSLHYGQLIFEGLKAYVNESNEIVTFRPTAHLERFNRSAVRLCMPQVNEEIFINGIREMVLLEQDWFPKEEGSSLYIRPFMMATDTTLGVNISSRYKFLVILSPVTKYYSTPVKVMVEPKYVRAAEGGLGFTKAAANYCASLYPTSLALQKGYNQLVWTDHKEHKYIEESGTMNIMFVIGNKLITPALSDSILSGITRDSILTVARDWGLDVEERKVSIDEVVSAYNDGTLKEMFGTGTAVVVSHIESFHYDGKDYVLPAPEKREFSNKVYKYLNDLRMGTISDPYGWVHKFE